MKDRIVTLDIFRIMSVFFIFLFHSNMHLGCSYGILTPFVSQGAIFMVAFFMISGFSLYLSYQDKDLWSLSNMKIFYIKRLVRIYPLYLFICIIFLIFYNPLTLVQTIIIAPIELLILQSFIDGSFGTLHNGGTWFISCLLLCYFLFPLFKEILTKIKKKKYLLFLFLYFIAFLSPIAVKIYNASSIYSNPFFRFFEFLLGMLIADLVIKNAEKVKKYQVVFVLVELLLLIIGVSILKKSILFENNYTMYNIIVIPLFALLLYNSSQIKNRFILKISGSSLVQYLSKISFAFFMAQFFSFAFTRRLLELSWFGDITNIKMILTAIIINLVLAILMYEIIEKPLSKVLAKRMIAKAK